MTNTREFIIDDKQGSRDRQVINRVIFNGKVFGLSQAEQMKLCVVEHLGFVKNGKWSFNTWRVTVNSAKLVSIMEPFDGLTEDINTTIDFVISCNRCDKLTREEAEAFVADTWPELVKKAKVNAARKAELI